MGEKQKHIQSKDGSHNLLQQTLNRYTRECEQQKDRIRELEKENRKLTNSKNKSSKVSDLENQLNQKKNYIDLITATAKSQEKKADDLREEIKGYKLQIGRLRRQLNPDEDQWAPMPVEQPSEKKPKKKKKKEK